MKSKGELQRQKQPSREDKGVHSTCCYFGIEDFLRSNGTLSFVLLSTDKKLTLDLELPFKFLSTLDQVVAAKNPSNLKQKESEGKGRSEEAAEAH